MEPKYEADEFTKKMNAFVKSIPNSRIILEVSKFCGYSEFVLVYNNDTLLELYRIRSLQFECPDVKGIYLTDNGQIKIPMTENILVRDYIRKNRLMRPEYPLPHPVVYKIYLDDGHCCPITKIHYGEEAATSAADSK